MSLAAAYQQMDRYDQALAAYQNLIEHARAAGNMTAELLGRSALGLLALHHGRLHLAFQTASQGLAWIERSGALPPLSTALYGELGEVYYRSTAKSTMRVAKRDFHGTLAPSQQKEQSHENPKRILPRKSICVHL
jgi:tetratricopeptide (TPR) repeat protein